MTTDYANIVKLLENIVGTMFSDSDKEFTLPVGYSVNYQPGLTNQIVSRLYAMDNSLTLYNEKVRLEPDAVYPDDDESTLS